MDESPRFVAWLPGWRRRRYSPAPTIRPQAPAAASRTASSGLGRVDSTVRAMMRRGARESDEDQAMTLLSKKRWTLPDRLGLVFGAG